MTKKAVEEFIKNAGTDKDVVKEIKAQIDNIVQVGRANGYKFTRKEFAQVLRDRWAQSGGSAMDFCYPCFPLTTAPKPKKPKPKPSKAARGSKATAKR